MVLKTEQQLAEERYRRYGIIGIPITAGDYESSLKEAKERRKEWLKTPGGKRYTRDIDLTPLSATDTVKSAALTPVLLVGVIIIALWYFLLGSIRKG